MMTTTLVLKCILLAKFQLSIVEVPIDQYGNALIEKTYNGMLFEATVSEERLNSLKIEDSATGAKTMTYSSRGYDQRSLSLNLMTRTEQASLDCDINPAP